MAYREDVWNRSNELDKQEEYDLSNALLSLNYLMETFEDEREDDETFQQWYDKLYNVWANSSEDGSEVYDWIADVSRASSNMDTEDVKLLESYIEGIVVK